MAIDTVQAFTFIESYLYTPCSAVVGNTADIVSFLPTALCSLILLFNIKVRGEKVCLRQGREAVHIGRGS